MSTYSDQIDVVLRDRLIPKMQSVSKDMATVEQYSYGSSQLLSLKRQSDYYSMIYDFLEEYLVGSEQIDNDKLINIVRLLESPDSEHRGPDYLGTIPEKKAKVKSGYTMYINGIEVGPETDITPGSVITIIIVYGSTRVITGSKSLEITSGTLDQTTDGFTIILQNMVIPLSLDGTFLEINAQAKENGIPLDSGHLFSVPIGDIANVTGTIILTTTLNGTFNLILNGIAGSGTINWGDASPLEPFTFNGSPINPTHVFTGMGNTITINSSLNLNNITAGGNDITSVIIPNVFINIERINLNVNLLTTFVGHREWVELQELTLYSNLLTSVSMFKEWVDLRNLNLALNDISIIDTFAEWINLEYLIVFNNNIIVLNTFDTWVNLVQLYVGNSHLTSLSTFPEWVNLSNLDIVNEPGITIINTYITWVNIVNIVVRQCNISSLNTFIEWTKIQSLDLSNNNLTSLTTFAEWTQLSLLFLAHNNITSLDTFIEWTSMSRISLESNPITYINIYKEWLNILTVEFTGCALTNINDVLIQLDASPIPNTGSIYLDGGTNMGAFGLGLVAANNLIARMLPTRVRLNTESFMSDIEGNQYAYRTIGTQVWTVENLKTTTYNDGSPIPNLTVNTDWVAQDGTENASDWFLPSVGEFEPMGTELYNHGLGNFVTGGPASARYWNSTEANATTALTWDFVIGGSAFTPKGNIQKIRACRAFYDLPGAYSLRSIGPAGGLIYIAQVIDVNRTLYYEAAPADLTPAAWSNVTTHLAGATNSAIGAGLSNTQIIMNQRYVGVDWFLPCKDELLAMYTQLKAFGVGLFSDGYYWSSTNETDLSAFTVLFNGGSSGSSLKTNGWNIRAVTSFVSSTAYNIRDIGPHGGWIFAKVLQFGSTYQYYETSPANDGISAWSNVINVFMPSAVATVIGSGIPNTAAIEAFPGSVSGAAFKCTSKDPSYAETASAARDTTNLTTIGNGNGAYVWYNNNIVNKDSLGALYNWYAVTKSKPYNTMVNNYGLLYNWYAVTKPTFAPIGWHVSTWNEWNTLVAYLGGSSVAGGKLKEIGTTHWSVPNTGATNSSGFTGLGAGHRSNLGDFSQQLQHGTFGTEFAAAGTWVTPTLYNDTDTCVTGASASVQSGFPIRLVKDDSIDPGTVTDIDGNIYSTTVIGTQVWTTTNFKSTHYNDGSDIKKITDAILWSTDISGAYCVYNNIEDTLIPILSPTGWHVPTQAEWQTLVTYLGGDTVAGGKMKEMGRWRWTIANVGATNESRLTMTTAGGRGSNGTFYPGNYQSTWSQTMGFGISSAYNEAVDAFDTESLSGTSDSRTGLPIRLVKD